MRKVPLSKKQKRAEKIKKTLIHVGIWLLGLLIVIALGVFAVRGFGIKTVIIDQSMNPTLQNEDVVLLNKLSNKICAENYRSSGGDCTDQRRQGVY